MILKTYGSCDTRSWDTYTIGNCRFSGGLLQVFQISGLYSKECAEGVHLERIPRLIFLAVRVGPGGYWILFTQL
jgi:hypothetical protein